LSLIREAHDVRAGDAGLLHRGLQIVSAEPGARLRHVGYVLNDQDIVRVFGVAEYLGIGEPAEFRLFSSSS